MEQMSGIPENIQEVFEQLAGWMKNVAAQPSQGLVEYKGKRFLPMTSVECIEYAMNEWQMPENSVVVASFPKTGTAWCMEIVRQILYGRNDDTLAKSKMIPGPLQLLEAGSKKKYDIFRYLPIPRKFFATHVPADLFNFDKLKESNSKVIYIYRNPKDQAVSWYHFAKKIPVMTEEQKADILGKDWNEFFAKYTAGEHPMSLEKGEWYPDHLIGWTKHANSENVLLVEYESLKKDFTKEVRKMSKFLDIDMTDDDLKEVSERCTVSAMKKEADCDKTGFLKMNVRKGEVGGWKNQLTVSQSELIDCVMEEKLSGKGINFTYVL